MNPEGQNVIVATPLHGFWMFKVQRFDLQEGCILPWMQIIVEPEISCDKNFVELQFLVEVLKLESDKPPMEFWIG